MQENTPQPQYMDDEIDLFELWDIIWSEKWTIIVVTVLFMMLAGAMGFYKQSQSTDKYRGELLIEIGQYMTKDGEKRNLHHRNDVSVFLGKQSVIKTQNPSGSNALIEVIAESSEEKSVVDAIENVEAIVHGIDDDLRQKIADDNWVSDSGIVHQKPIHQVAPDNKLVLFIVLGAILGGMFSLFFVLVRHAYKNRKATLDN